MILCCLKPLQSILVLKVTPFVYVRNSLRFDKSFKCNSRFCPKVPVVSGLIWSANDAMMSNDVRFKSGYSHENVTTLVAAQVPCVNGITFCCVVLDVSSLFRKQVPLQCSLLIQLKLSVMCINTQAPILTLPSAHVAVVCLKLKYVQVVSLAHVYPRLYEHRENRLNTTQFEVWFTIIFLEHAF